VVLFLYVSGSADPYHWVTDPDPAIFISGSRWQQKVRHFLPTVGTIMNYIRVCLQR
jgi:hypothetical protein